MRGGGRRGRRSGGSRGGGRAGARDSSQGRELRQVLGLLGGEVVVGGSRFDAMTCHRAGSR